MPCSRESGGESVQVVLAQGYFSEKLKNGVWAQENTRTRKSQTTAREESKEEVREKGFLGKQRLRC
jgi:hypothetical protein